MRVLNVFVLVALMGCSTAREYREAKVAEYKMITKDLCIENKTEVRLAQHLYNYMLKSD